MPSSASIAVAPSSVYGSLTVMVCGFVPVSVITGELPATTLTVLVTCVAALSEISVTS